MAAAVMLAQCGLKVYLHLDTIVKKFYPLPVKPMYNHRSIYIPNMYNDAGTAKIKRMPLSTTAN
jgi:hypothetical protein